MQEMRIELGELREQKVEMDKQTNLCEHLKSEIKEWQKKSNIPNRNSVSRKHISTQTFLKSENISYETDIGSYKPQPLLELSEICNADQKRSISTTPPEQSNCMVSTQKASRSQYRPPLRSKQAEVKPIATKPPPPLAINFSRSVRTSRREREQNIAESFEDKLDCKSIGEYIKESRRKRSISQERSKLLDESIEDTLHLNEVYDNKAPVGVNSSTVLKRKVRECLLKFASLCENLQHQSIIEDVYSIQLSICEDIKKTMRSLGLISDYTAAQTHFTSSVSPKDLLDPLTMQVSKMSASKSSMVSHLLKSRDNYMMLWGDNSHFQVARNSKKQIPVATFYPGALVKQVSLGPSVTFAIDCKGRLIGWGKADLLCQEVDKDRPTTIKELSSKIAVQVCCAAEHVLCLTSDGLVTSWGSGSKGQLGQGKIKGGASNPRVVAPLMGKFVKRIQTAYYSSAAITGTPEFTLDKDELYTWGDNSSCQLFLESLEEHIHKPEKALSSLCISTINIGRSHSLATDVAGSVYWSGFKNSNHLKPPGLENQLHKELIDRLPDNAGVLNISKSSGRVTRVLAGDQFSLLLNSNINSSGKGSIFSMGLNVKGCLGLDIQEDEIITSPTLIPLPGTCIYVSANDLTCWAIIETSPGCLSKPLTELYTWGQHSDHDRYSSSPVKHRTDEGLCLLEVHSAASHNCILYNKEKSTS